MSYRTFKLDQRGDLEAEIDRLNRETWPEFLIWLKHPS